MKTTSKDILGIEHDRSKWSVVTRCHVAAGLALAILLTANGVANASEDGTSPTPPVSQCSDFACEK